MDFPSQYSGRSSRQLGNRKCIFDMRDWLTPRRMTMVMWDQAFLLRHLPGESFEDYDRVLDELEERGYNTVRLDPLPQLVDLEDPSRIYTWDDPAKPFMPWCWSRGGEGPLGKWLAEFMEKLRSRDLGYVLSAWWFSDEKSLLPIGSEALAPRNHCEAAEIWARLLRSWKQRFGFEGLAYVDIANEIPYFLPGYMNLFEQATDQGWNEGGAPFNQKQIDFLANDINQALSALQKEFPDIRFTGSIHGDERWFDVPLQFDCLDVHFYADVDPRWKDRTRFLERIPVLWTDDSWHRDFSDRCMKTHKAIAPMLRMAQRNRLAAFSLWADEQGMPLTTTESWASWFYIDSPDLDWSWLLQWAEWSVEDAIEYRMWGWTPHNYCQPQFANWKDVRWHRRLTERFLRS